ncbi:hypothetical protein [Thaumasiovibrio subtropicus]|uniref:hypothetical protein n=1 Tax=Thaumasiovibrio subtropicus TaxID=1891207 RepID=UPI000B35C273|nr:hypothetical protein [Thaumasiovibrio subtropicus]
MFRQLLKVTAALAVITLLSACQSTPIQPTINLDTNELLDSKSKVGIIYLPPIHEATTHIEGASCLLCYGVAAALTASLDTHLESTIGDDELLNIKQLIIDGYEERFDHVEITKLPVLFADLEDFKGGLGFAPHDFSLLKEELGLDYLVVYEVYRHGAYRSFSNYFPNGDPLGHISGRVYSVNLNNNAYLQYLEFDEKVQPAGNWDEPSDFPSVTTSYYQAIENAKQKIRTVL